MDDAHQPPGSAGSGRHEHDALRHLEDVYAASERVPVDVAAMSIAPLLAPLGADVAFVGRVSDDGASVEIARVTPSSKNPVRLAFRADSPYPLAAVLRRRQPLFVASNKQLACDHPGLIRVREDDHACATMPLLSPTGQLVGALNIGFAEAHEFSEVERAQITGLAEQCAALLSPPTDA